MAKINGEDIAQYTLSLKAYRDRIAEHITAIEDGIKMGLELAEADKEKYAKEKANERAYLERLEMAKNCLEDGMSNPKIAKLTGI